MGRYTAVLERYIFSTKDFLWDETGKTKLIF